MKKPEIPVNESDRLVALDRYKILDTLPEQVYDDLTQLAADICGTPIALISLVEKDRQWFKSRVGIDVSETPRDISFCGHAVAANAILNVPDASLDPRFADNPLVAKDPSIRFYVGVPLVTDDNFALGTLCVIDRQPRDLTEKQIRQLEALSRLVISQFELRLKKESLRLLASVVESSDDAIITKTLEGIITSWNPAAERLFGYSEAEAIGQPIFMLFPPDRLDEEPRILSLLRRGERVEHFETVRISKEGKSIEVSATISPLVNDAGQVVGASTILRDISDRKQAQIDLEESEQSYVSLMAASPVGIFRTDAMGHCTYINDRWCRISGLTLESAIGDGWRQGVHPEDRQLVAAEWYQSVQENRSFSLEYRFQCPDGVVTWVYGQSAVTYNADGIVAGYIGTITDISDRKRTEKELHQLNQELEGRVESRTSLLKESEVKSRAILATIPDLMIRVGADRVYREQITPHRETSIYSRDFDIIGRSIDEIFPSENVQLKIHYLQQAIQTGELQVYEQQIQINDRLKYEEVRIMKYGEDEALLMIRDISDRKRAEQALQQLNQTLEAKVQERTQEIQLQAQMLEQIHDAVISTALDGTILTWNFGAERLYEYKSDEAIGQNVCMLYLNEDLHLMESEVFSPLLEKGTHEVELRNRTKSGNVIDIGLRLSVVRDAMENPIRLIGCSNNISDRKQAENALRDSQALFQTVLDAFPLSIFWKDRQSVILGCNRLFAINCGMKSSVESIGKGIFDFSYTNDEALGYLADDRQVMESGLAKLNIEEMITLPSGEQRWVQTNKIPLRDSEGNVIGVMGTFQDISDRKQAEEALRESEEVKRRILESSTDCIKLIDLDGRILYINEGGLYVLEIDDSSVIHNAHWSSLWPEASRSEVEASAMIAKSGQTGKFQGFCPTTKGTPKWWDVAVTPIRDKDGQVIQLLAVSRDITDRKQAEIALQESRKFIQTVVDTIPMPLFWKDRESTYLGCNAQFAAIFNLESTDAMIGKNDFDLSSTEAEAIAYRQDDREVMESGKSKLNIMETLTLPDGSQIWLETHKAPLRDWANNVIGVVVMFQDITNRKLTEEALRASDQRWKFALESAGDGVWDWGVKNNEVFYSPQWKAQLGYTDNEIENRFEVWESLVHPDDLAQCYENINKCLNSEVLLYESEHRLRCKDGSYKWILSRGKVLEWDADGHALRVMGTHTDLSDRKQAEAQLQKINDELLRATKLKDEFLANMSHELRTPLNAILGMSESLKEEVLGSLNEKQLKAIATVESSGEHLLALINDILDLSKISAGIVELDIASVSVKNLCSSSLVFVKQQAFNKRIQIHSHIPTNINNINIDERRIKQVLINLLTNAVKFTPREGEVNLLVAIGSGDSWQGEATIPQRLRAMNAPTILFQVVDTGIGIAAKDLKMLFQPFVQVDSALNRQYEGTGLGLALVKQIVELHGGQAIAESEVGQGSRFTVALPCEMSEFNAIASMPTSPTSSSLEIASDNAPLILLAEDNEANIQTFSSYLTAIKYRVIIARNGIEAIAQAQENLPDIILMDIQMPTMDGLEATKQIRLDPNLANIPIVALTALAMSGDRERCLEAGANDYLAKPIKLKELNTTIQRLITDT